jgi:hypothetical protein
MLELVVKAHVVHSLEDLELCCRDLEDADAGRFGSTFGDESIAIYRQS